jgi:hypothetical protein
MDYSWVPVFGEFLADEDSIQFRGKWLDVHPGPSEQQEQRLQEGPRRLPALGIILSDQEISEGRISAEVTFEELGPSSGCEIVVGFDVETKSYVSAGITGFEQFMFSIREWSPPPQASQIPGEQPRWVPYSVGGDRSNLRAGRPYRVDVSVSGPRLSLSIDGVHLASALLRSWANRPKQVGFWCSNHSQVTIKNVRIDGEQPKAFVVMQFSEPYNEVYSQVIRDTCRLFGLEAVRADEIYGPGLIIKDVIDQILNSRVVIADISPPNPNVYFEVGYALAWGKPIVLLAKKGTDLPFDVSAFRVLFYEDSISGKSRVEEGLKRHLRAIVVAA